MASTSTGFEGEINCIARVIGKPGKAEDLISLFKAVKTSSDGDTEPGTLSYEIIRYEDEICVVEKFENAAAIRTHTQTAPYKELGSKLLELIVDGSLSLKFYESV